MKKQSLRWSDDKNEWLIAERGISFEELAQAIQSGALLDDIKHPTKEHQRVLLVWCQNYVWAVPYVKQEEGVFFKTAFKSRKYNQRYGHE
ncbi:MAG: toxin [bacterium]|nr:toxin [bacterium]